ncbi:MAG: hypothetical protein R3200_05950 [Xanthomonadales bacterium]|nr:hypothetical protein [Xanthomonadales bacterium]
MRLLFSLNERSSGKRLVRTYELEHLEESAEQILADWRHRERTQVRGQALTLAIAGLGPCLGHFVLGLPSSQLFLLVVIDAFVVLIGDWIKYLVAPLGVQREIATADQDLETLQIIRRYLKFWPRRTFEVSWHDRTEPELLRTVLLTEPYAFGHPLLIAGLATAFGSKTEFPATFWILTGLVAGSHLLQAYVTAYRARDDEALEPQLVPQGIDYIIMVTIAGFAWIVFGELLDDWFSFREFAGHLFFGLLGVVAVAVAIFWLYRLRARRNLLVRFIHRVRETR